MRDGYTECIEDPTEWDKARVLQLLRDAGISPAGAVAIEDLGLDGAMLMRLTPADFETDELCLEEADQRCVLGLTAKLVAGEPLVSAEPAVKHLTIPSVLVDADGHSYFGERSVALKGSSSANSIGLLSEMQGTRGLQFRETPADYAFDWHTAPHKQYVVCLDGGVQIEVSKPEGDKRVFPPGSVFFVGDTHGRGHRSTSVNGQVRRSIFIQLDE